MSPDAAESEARAEAEASFASMRIAWRLRA